MAETPDPKQPHMRPVLNPQEARQGETGHNVRYVLAAGTLAIVVAFFALYLAFFA